MNSFYFGFVSFSEINNKYENGQYKQSFVIGQSGNCFGKNKSNFSYGFKVNDIISLFYNKKNKEIQLKINNHRMKQFLKLLMKKN